MPSGKNVISLDANILLDYLLQHQLNDKDRKNRITKLFHRSNDGNYEIRIFAYTLGEVFKRLLEPRNNGTMKLDNNEMQKRLKDIQKWINEKFITPIKIDSLDQNFHKYYEEIDEKDSMIQKGDKLTIAAFCADEKSSSFYSFDKGIIQSVWLQEYVGRFGKKIQEP